MESIRVFAPATVANVACGFDIFGFAVHAPGDELILRKKNTPGLEFSKITGDNNKLPTHPDKNTASISIARFLEHIDSRQGFSIELHKKMPLGSGLGSSAASAVAGVFAANQLMNNPLTIKELLPFVMEGERMACGAAHADNVAPALLGGFVVIRSYEPLDVFKIPTPDDLFVSIIHPQIEVNTKDARIILRQDISLKKTITQMGNVAGLVMGLMQSDYGLISRSLVDVIIEPFRSILIPHFQELKELAVQTGALGASISGSGPSIFALSKGHETAEKVSQSFERFLTSQSIPSDTYVSSINEQGPIILESL